MIVRVVFNQCLTQVEPLRCELRERVINLVIQGWEVFRRNIKFDCLVSDLPASTKEFFVRLIGMLRGLREGVPLI
jgi:hypothetical protein